MDRIAVVTGANRGIGLAVVEQLLSRGYRTVLGAREAEAGRQAARELDANGRVLVAELDVTEERSTTALGELLRAEFGQVDVLVNNAGVHYDTWQDPAGADMRIVTEALEVNAIGAWRTTTALLPLMRGNRPGRRIVNVSSGIGALSDMGAGTPAYAVSKAALNAVTRVFAAQCSRDRILVNAVCPGWVATRMGGRGGRTIEAGAASVLWAVDIPEDGPTGGFFRDGRRLSW
ncbi:SDR family NAD(P)-dependent oxidoreductase [Sciscionella sediminilitoris]|uniref:SDR family NAD(P)-dependent oxidoreductase n=1 Tax=Sciscionella sediminilitoris TaxID=1445613 RepID=UPI000691A2C5|nr:SDR family NAD(P)-dependent oxidoreductase [Sciscionella sp. SE31]